VSLRKVIATASSISSNNGEVESSIDGSADAQRSQQLSRLKSGGVGGAAVRRVSTSSVRMKSMMDVTAMLNNIVTTKPVVENPVDAEEPDEVMMNVAGENEHEVMNSAVRAPLAVTTAAESKRRVSTRSQVTPKVSTSSNPTTSTASSGTMRRRSMSGVAESLDSVLKSTEGINCASKAVKSSRLTAVQENNENAPTQHNKQSVKSGGVDKDQVGKTATTGQNRESITRSEYTEVWLDI
jgi:hypothetical protein